MNEQLTCIETAIEGRIGILRFNRGRKHNAFNMQMMAEVTEALRDFNENRQVNAVVVTGASPSFSAGFDLKELAAQGYTTPAEWQAAIAADFDYVMQFWDFPKPTIAAVEGFCLGSGLEVAVACDITVAGDKAVFGVPEVKFGSSIVALILPWIIGPKYAKELLLTGNDRIDAARAAQIGLVNHVVDDSTAFARAMDIAREIASASVLSVQLTKRAIQRTADIQGMREALRWAADTAVFIESSAGADNAEFNRIAVQEGMKAAIAWRDSRA